ncbi:putative C-type lectin domain family 20 member A [Ictalurus punctatus]|uniref:C-type lectin domain family 20 member A n=1 Tax=Ictalurus punctatus TaxID=7998 RepID=A0A2D0SDH2_ICTPU|nr:putative C-type lectin domain family 20 member A [Ictalurus punctatus]
MKMKAVLSVLVLAALTGAATALFWRKYIHVNEQLNWSDAQKYCRENYTDLAIFETQEEQDRFQNHITTPKSCWIGLSRNSNTYKFTQWSDGSLSSFQQWSTGEPSWDNEKNCVYIQYSWWTSHFCKDRLTFICYTWKPELIVVQEMKTWEEALNYCRMHYTDLVSLDTKRDQQAVNSMSNETLTPSFWTGLRFLDGSWFWVNQVLMDEQSLGSLSVMPSCPAPRFHCGARNARDNVLENRDCEEKMNFICYNRIN